MVALEFWAIQRPEYLEKELRNKRKRCIKNESGLDK